MALLDSLTPKDTEEIKPGLFVKKTRKGYRVVNPIAWNGKFRTKEQLKTIISARTFLTLAILFFVVYNYYEDNEKLINFYNRVHENPIRFCQDVMVSLQNPTCSEQDEKSGLCFNNYGLDISLINFTAISNEDTSSLS